MATTLGAAPANFDIQMAPMQQPEQVSSPPPGLPGHPTMVVSPMDHPKAEGTPQAPPQPVVVSSPPASPGSPTVIVNSNDSPQPHGTHQTPPESVGSPPPGLPAEPNAVASPTDNPQPRPQSPLDVSNVPMGPVPPRAPADSPPQGQPGQPIADGIPVPESPVYNPQPLETPQTPQAQSSSWSITLYDCGFSDLNTCCLVLWCPCIAFGRMAEILDEGKSSCLCQGTLYFIIHVLSLAAAVIGSPITFHFLLTYKYRGKLKQKLDMPPGCCEDFWTHMCCEQCALCQEYHELQACGYDPSLGWHGNMEKQRQATEMPTMVSAPASPSMKR